MRVKKTFGLTEIIVGSVIIASAFTGLVTTFIATRRYIERSRRRLTAVNIARSYFNQWYNGLLNTDDGEYTLSGEEGNYFITNRDINRDGWTDYYIVTIRVNF